MRGGGSSSFGDGTQRLAPARPSAANRGFRTSGRRPNPDRAAESRTPAPPITPRSVAIAPSVAAGHTAQLVFIDEDRKRALTTTAALELHGFAVRCAGDGPDGLALMSEQTPDLLLVNATLPRLSGIDVCRQVRRTGSQVPIIVLSPRSDEIEVVVALEMGADDFIAEPYGVNELVARIRSVLRRSQRPAAGDFVRPPSETDSPRVRRSFDALDAAAQYGLTSPNQLARTEAPQFGSSGTAVRNQEGDGQPEVLTVGDLSLDRARHEVLLGGKAINFPKREFILLEALLEKPGRLLTSEVLIERIWGPGFWTSSRNLSTLVNRLRAQIESDADHPTRIVTIRGIGYRYEAAGEDGT